MSPIEDALGQFANLPEDAVFQRLGRWRGGRVVEEFFQPQPTGFAGLDCAGESLHLDFLGHLLAKPGILLQASHQFGAAFGAEFGVFEPCGDQVFKVIHDSVFSMHSRSSLLAR
jgi:hypothetical protein